MIKEGTWLHDALYEFDPFSDSGYSPRLTWGRIRWTVRALRIPMQRKFILERWRYRLSELNPRIRADHEYDREIMANEYDEKHRYDDCDFEPSVGS